jgi:hypothetical protein
VNCSEMLLGLSGGLKETAETGKQSAYVGLIGFRIK